MAIIYDKKIFRNLQEQVEKNKQDIVDLQQTEMALNAYGIKVVGQVETALDIPDDFEGDYGDAYLVGEEAPYDVYVWTRPNSETPEDHFVDIGPIAIVGPQGPQGPQGATGATGAQGIGWTNSSDNPASVPVGTFGLNALNGDVYQSNGTSWVLRGNIKGPQGAQGQQGPTGATGATGAQGPQGPKGDTGSSYQVIGTYASTSVLPDPTLVNPGSAALVGASAPYELYIVVGATQDVQLWQDAGVFNDQPEEITVLTFLGSQSLNTMRSFTLSAEQQQILANSYGKPAYIYYIINDYERKLFQKVFERKETLAFMRFTSISSSYNSNNQTNEVDAYNARISVTGDTTTLIFYPYARLEMLRDKVDNILSNSTSTTKYPCTKAVYDYVQPYANQIPIKSAAMEIQGGKGCDDFVITIFSNVEARNEWLTLGNTFLNTNYTFSQMLTYLQTSINALEQAPSTNLANIISLINMFTLMPMTTGKIEIRTKASGIVTKIYETSISNIDLQNQAWSAILIEGLALGDSMENILGTSLMAFIRKAIEGDPSIITDSDSIAVSITNNL